MSPEDASYEVGNVGEGATVLQGNYLTNVNVQVQNVEDARAVLSLLNKELGRRSYHGPLLRRLDPIVLANRAGELSKIRAFFEESSDSLLFVVGLAGIGKSTLVRGALEYRGSNTPAVWITCEGLDVERLLTDVDAGLGLGLQSTLHDPKLDAIQKIAALLGAVQTPSIPILDNFEDLLDEDEHYKHPAMADFVQALTAYEHRAKTIVTTRRLPSGVGTGSAGMEILRLGGLDNTRAVELFQIRTELSIGETEQLLTPHVIEKLEGHPKFIELLALAMSELPLKEILQGMLSATDIGQYIVSQVLVQLDETELDILRAALIFRGAFSFDALAAVYQCLHSDGSSIASPVRSLVRRAILEVNAELQTAYYLHSVLRDAVPRNSYQEASAHAAAAQWFGKRDFNAEDLTTWDDTLYHLQRAAEIGRQPEFIEPYQSFIFDKFGELENAGWGRRNVNELQTLDALLGETDSGDRFNVRWVLGMQLWLLSEYESAFDLFRDLSDSLTEYLEIAPDEEKNGIGELLILVNAKLGDTLVRLGDHEAARKYADGIETIVATSPSTQHQLRYAELRFAIAREIGEPNEMLVWAQKSFDLASQWVKEENTSQTLNALAEAHFNMAITRMRLGQKNEATNHFLNQLRLKLEIGRLSGLGAGLFNLGVMYYQNDPLGAAAMLLTSEQIQHEIGEVKREWAEQEFAQIYASFLADPANFMSGRNLLSIISSKLVPYYMRMLERRTGKPIQLPPPG